MKVPFVVALAVLAGGSSAARAEPPPSVRALLADPAQLAAWLRARDPAIQAARDKTEAASDAADQAHALPNPELSATAGGFVLGQTTVDDTGRNANLSLGQTTNVQLGLGELIELGKRAPRIHAAELRTHAAQEGEVSALGDALGDATTTLGRLAYVSARRNVVADNLAAARTLRNLEKNRLDQKDLSPLEFARIELDTQELELQLGRAEAELAGAVAACSAILYAPCTADGLDATALDAAAPLPKALPAEQTAIEARPARRAEQFEAEALGQDATLASRRKIPDPTLGVGYLLDNLVVAGNQHQQLLFSIGFPLPLFDRGAAEAAADRANARAIRAQGEATVREQQGVVDALLAQRASLQATLARLETDAVPRSTQIIDQTRKAFDLGQAGLADLLLAERAHRDLLLEVLGTRFDLFNVRAQLRQALGLDDQAARAAGGPP